MRRIVAVAALALSACAHSFKYGIGLNSGADFPDTSTKILSVVEQDQFLTSPLQYQWEGGLFVDNNNGLGPTGFGSFALGLETEGPGLFASYFVGPTLITQTDARLASILEFNNNFQLGIRDRRGAAIGLNFQHFSNAGLTQGNIGRDFLGINLTFPF